MKLMYLCLSRKTKIDESVEKLLRTCYNQDVCRSGVFLPCSLLLCFLENFICFYVQMLFTRPFPCHATKKKTNYCKYVHGSVDQTKFFHLMMMSTITIFNWLPLSGHHKLP